ncbi:MAG TPA: cation-translocating P-type ATPase, partial [Candidatus Brocadiaceae bacterium]|nr:cation-translocating P-type ATPase [Candidatus Brocadiaceae bacterium]
DNIKKSIHYLLSCNTGEILTMLLASIFNLPLPLFPIQILWINIATDGFPALALGVDPVDPDVMKRPARRSSEQIVDRRLGTLMVFQGLLIAASTLFAYLCVLYYTSRATQGFLHWFSHEVISGELSGDVARARTVAFCVMVVSQLFHSFNCRSVRLSLFKVGVFTNKKLLLATGISLAMQITIVYIPYLEDVFKVTPLAARDWLTVFGFSALIFVVVEAVKGVKRGL